MQRGPGAVPLAIYQLVKDCIYRGKAAATATLIRQQDVSMYTGTTTKKTFWAAKPGQTECLEVVLDGACGDKCGYVRCIETGDRWMTYGYTTLAPAGEIKQTVQYSR